MLYPQVVIYQGDGKLVSSLQDLANEHKWILREHKTSQSLPSPSGTWWPLGVSSQELAATSNVS